MILVKVGHFGAQGSVDKKLEDAFERLAIFCKNSRKHTSIVEFSKKQFKINKGLPVSKGCLRYTRLISIYRTFTWYSVRSLNNAFRPKKNNHHLAQT